MHRCAKSDEGTSHPQSEKSGTRHLKKIGISHRRDGAGCLVSALGLALAAGLGCESSRPTPTWASAPARRDVALVSDLSTVPVRSTRRACSRVELGRSVNGLPIVMSLYGGGSQTILVVGGMHGDEPTGSLVALGLQRQLEAHPERLAGYTVGVIAQANPDGLRSGQRSNARGVDLNRNFPARDWCPAASAELPHGPSALSEPETLAIVTAVELLQPLRIVDIHSIEHGWHCNNYDGPAEELAELMSHFNGYPSRVHIGYPTPGSLGNWAGIDRGIPTITLEMPRALNAARCWRENAAALFAFIGARDAGPSSAVLAVGSNSYPEPNDRGAR